MTTPSRKKLSFRLNITRKVMNSQSENIADLYGEICKLNHTLKLHGEAHMAQDLLPQFTALCKKVDAEISGNGKQMSTHIEEHRTNSAKLEAFIFRLRDRMDVLESQGPHTCHNHGALTEDRTRIIAIEDRLNNSPFSKVVMDNFRDRIKELENERAGSHSAHDSTFAIMQDLNARCTENEEGIAALLKILPEVEILKVKVAGIEQDNPRSYAVHHKEAFDAVYAKMKEQRSDYHGHIRQLVEENAAAHIQMSDTIMGMKEELVQLRKAATLQGQHIVGLEKAKEDDIFPARGRLTLVAEKVDALEQNLSQYQNADRVQANRQAVAIEKLQKQVEGLETRLSRAQDLVAAMENEKADVLKPAIRPADPGCTNCLYGSNGPGEGPCRECFPPEWPNWKPERKPRLDTTPRNCSTCRYQRRGADDEPCKRCVVTDGWTPKIERKPRAPRARDAGGKFAPATSKTFTPRKRPAVGKVQG